MEYDVFISYSRKDYVDENKVVKSGNIVSYIKNVLSENGITFWFDEEGVYSGDAFAPLIAKHIKASKIFLFISSENSNASEWTSNEIAVAHAFKKKIIPFRYDDSVYNDSVILYIAKLDYIDYQNNPAKSLNRLVSSIQIYLKELREKEENARREEKLRVESEQRKEERAMRLKSLRERIVTLENKKFSLKKDILRIEQDLAELNNELHIVECELQNCRDEEQMLAGDAIPGHNQELFSKTESGQIKKEYIKEEKSTGAVEKKRGRKNNLFSHYFRKHHIITIVIFCLITIGLWGLSIVSDGTRGGIYVTGLSLFFSLLLFQLFRLRAWAYPLLLAFAPWLSVCAVIGGFDDWVVGDFFMFFCLALMVLSIFFFLKKDGKSTWERFRIKLLWKRLWANIRQQPDYVRLYLYLGMLLGASLWIWILMLDCKIHIRLFGTVLAALYIYSLWLILRMKKSGLILLFLSLGFHIILALDTDYTTDVFVQIIFIPILLVILLTSRSKQVWKTNWKKDLKISFSKNWDCILIVLLLVFSMSFS